MASIIHDPGHTALRRGIRAAVALPLGLALALYAFDDEAGVLFTVFGIVGLLVNADFAGSARQRLGSYLLTGVAGTITLLIGWAASLTTPSAFIVTILVAFALSFLNLFRGSVAVGTPAVLLVFVVAVTVSGPATDLPSFLLGWWLAVAVSTATALLLLPRDRRADNRTGLADAFDAAAEVARTTWLEPGTPTEILRSVRVLDAAVDRLDTEFGGQPLRTTGLTERDGILTLLVNHVDSTRLLIDDTDRLAVRRDAIPLPEREDLAAALVAALDSLAVAMRDPHSLPSGQRLDDARVHLTAGMQRWVVEASTAGMAPQDISTRIGGDHLLRMSALIVEQMVELARIANGGEGESLERRPPLPERSLRGTLLAQLNPASPWFRNSLRSALGLGLAILVVSLTGVDHGFWVLLGVISILRFDALGTRRFAVQAIVGTVVGVILGTVIIVTLADQPVVLWILLPITVFLSAWSSAAISYPVGQAAFSLLILVALGIVEWPPRTAVGLVRIEDMALGAAVAVVVGLLLWPRGAAGYLRAELAAAVRTARDYLSAAIGAFVTPTSSDQLLELRERAIAASDRATETYDIALMQRGPAEDVRMWSAVRTYGYLLISAGRVASDFAVRAPLAVTHPELGADISRASTVSDAHWEALVTRLEADDAGAPAPAGGTTAAPPYPTLQRVGTVDDAYALIVAVWVVDWVRHLDRLTA